MQAAAALAPVASPVCAEDAGRADFYALLAALFFRAPDAKLLQTVAIAPALPGGDSALARAWSGLVAASAVFDPEAAAEEYESLFVGVGKAPVSVFAGFYGKSGGEPQRVHVIADLAALGLSHGGRPGEPEDHFAGLFETMRILVAGGAGRSPAPVGEQKRFYEAHVAPGVFAFFKAIEEARQANFYLKVAALGKAFAAIESESFNLG